jgi:hypothetical protein
MADCTSTEYYAKIGATDLSTIPGLKIVSIVIPEEMITTEFHASGANGHQLSCPKGSSASVDFEFKVVGPDPAGVIATIRGLADRNQVVPIEVCELGDNGGTPTALLPTRSFDASFPAAGYPESGIMEDRDWTLSLPVSGEITTLVA